MRPPRTDRRQRAFTLIEVAVSVAILGGVLAGALTIRWRARHAAYAARETQTCADLCASRVAALRGGATGVGRGAFTSPEGYRWTIRDLKGDGDKGVRAYEVSVRPPSGEEKSAAKVIIWLYREATTEEETP